MRHVVERKDIKDSELVISSELLGSCGRGVKKQLLFCCKPLEKEIWFEVSDHDILVLKTENFDEALEKYNECL